MNSDFCTSKYRLSAIATDPPGWGENALRGVPSCPKCTLDACLLNPKRSTEELSWQNWWIRRNESTSGELGAYLLQLEPHLVGDRWRFTRTPRQESALVNKNCTSFDMSTCPRRHSVSSMTLQADRGVPLSTVNALLQWPGGGFRNAYYLCFIIIIILLSLFCLLVCLFVVVVVLTAPKRARFGKQIRWKSWVSQPWNEGKLSVYLFICVALTVLAGQHLTWLVFRLVSTNSGFVPPWACSSRWSGLEPSTSCDWLVLVVDELFSVLVRTRKKNQTNKPHHRA